MFTEVFCQAKNNIQEMLKLDLYYVFNCIETFDIRIG